MAKGEVQVVNFDPFALQLFEDFDRYCDDQINSDNSREVCGICGTVPTLRR
jgi:hypothetical protein